MIKLKLIGTDEDSENFRAATYFILMWSDILDIGRRN
jgi:hypothetical protein